MSHDTQSITGELNAKDQAMIDLVLSDKGGKMTIGQVANLFNVGNDAVMHAIRMHSTNCGRGTCRGEVAREGV